MIYRHLETRRHRDYRRIVPQHRDLSRDLWLQSGTTRQVALRSHLSRSERSSVHRRCACSSHLMQRALQPMTIADTQVASSFDCTYYVYVMLVLRCALLIIASNRIGYRVVRLRLYFIGYLSKGAESSSNVAATCSCLGGHTDMHTFTISLPPACCHRRHQAAPVCSGCHTLRKYVVCRRCQARC